VTSKASLAQVWAIDVTARGEHNNEGPPLRKTWPTGALSDFSFMMAGDPQAGQCVGATREMEGVSSFAGGSVTLTRCTTCGIRHDDFSTHFYRHHRGSSSIIRLGQSDWYLFGHALDNGLSDILSLSSVSSRRGPAQGVLFGFGR
jgi:hypothetical protein